MIRFFTIIMTAVLMAVFLPACSDDPQVRAKVDAARARNDAPPIWIITDPQNDIGTLYIFGAVHILPEDFDWLRPDLTAAFNSAGTVFFEVSGDEASQNRAAVITAGNGYFSPPKTLPDILDGYNQRRLVAATLNAGLKDGALDSYRPWLAADILAIAALQQAGMSGEHGADNILRKRAAAQGKYTRYLETMDEHLSESAILPERLQKAELITTIDGLDDLARQTGLMNAAWASGNTAYLETDILAPLRAKAPDYYDALFTRRNEKWAQTLETFVKDGGDGLAVIGIGHMLGDGNLGEQLEARGLLVKRHYAFLGNNVIKTVPLDMGN